MKGVVRIDSAFSGVALVLSVLFGAGAKAGDFEVSAHGSKVYGASRASVATPRGQCIQCHQPQLGLDRFLFSANFVSQTEGVCMRCHTDTNSVQTGGLVNRSYSFRAGGYTADTVSSVRTAFAFGAPGSAHNLADIRGLIASRWGFPSQPNPCSACHNPHSAQGDPGNAPNGRKTPGSRGWISSRPTSGMRGAPWGVALAERMSAFAGAAGGIYQAPYAATGFEPEGSNTSDGSNLADFPTLCSDCHNPTTSILSTTLNRAVRQFDWKNELHGGGAAASCSKVVSSTPTSLLAPPYDGLTRCGQYVLSCTDCHEPHGSPNNFLIRKQVNGGLVTVVDGGAGLYPPAPDPAAHANGEWIALCSKCHVGLGPGGYHVHPTQILGDTSGCSGSRCHTFGTNPFVQYRNCADCHSHGNSQIDGTPYPTRLF